MTDSPIVTVFTHEKSDSTHSVVDRPAVVLGSYDDPVRGEVLRVKVFAWGEPPRDLEVSEFPDEAPVDAQGNIIYGGTYWREWGSDAPDFEPVYDAKQQELYDAEKAKLDAKQAEELANTPEQKHAAQASVHTQQQLILAHKYGRDLSQPEPVVQPEPRPATVNTTARPEAVI